jgi:hypothetical protein
MKTFTCKLAGLKNASVYQLSYDELCNMSVQYPMFLLVDGNWKGIIHTKEGMVY